MKTEITLVEKMAQELYADRKARWSHPSGKSDGKRWYSDQTEKCACCAGIRSPSAAFPWSAMVHCRTLKHCRALFAEALATGCALPKDAEAIRARAFGEAQTRAENPSVVVA